MLRNTFINFGKVSTASVRIPHFEKASTTQMQSAFGEILVEETASGHFYSDHHIMATDTAPMMDMCHTEDHDNFSDHIIATNLGEFGEIED